MDMNDLNTVASRSHLVLILISCIAAHHFECCYFNRSLWCSFCSMSSNFPSFIKNWFQNCIQIKLTSFSIKLFYRFDLRDHQLDDLFYKHLISMQTSSFIRSTIFISHDSEDKIASRKLAHTYLEDGQRNNLRLSSLEWTCFRTSIDQVAIIQRNTISWNHNLVR